MYFDRCVRIYQFPKPTIAAVQGKCIAAGMMLAAMCDLIVASDDAVFQNPVARMSGMGVELLVEPWELGIRKAKEFLLTGMPIGAEEALGYGMVNRVVPRDSLPAAAREMADEIAKVPPMTAERIKDSINHTYELMGKRSAWDYHFMAHHFTHNTAAALGLLAEREEMGSMKEVFDARDRGDA
jgi:enoyl-CoA hydratase